MINSSLDISILIVNFNARELVLACLKSVYETTRRHSFEIIVIDNHSTDGSAVEIRARFPQAILIENTENVGFARANNQGIAQSRGRYFLLLNPDSVVLPDAIDVLVDFMDREPEVGIAGPTLLDAQGTTRRSFRAFPSPRDEFLQSVFLDRLASFFVWDIALLHAKKQRIGHSVDWITGACLIIRRQMTDRVGVFDPNYFLYYEEVDLCLRAKKDGWRVQLVPEALVVHYGGRSTSRYLTFSLVASFKSRYYYFRKHSSPEQYHTVRSWIRLGLRNRYIIWTFISLFGFKQNEARERLQAYNRILSLKKEPSIAVDTTSIVRSKAGVGCYTKHLVSRLLTGLSENGSAGQYLVYQFGGSSSRAAHPVFSSRALNAVKRVFWEQIVVPLRLMRRQVRLFHSPAFTCHLLKTCPIVITIHDLAYMIYPEKFVRTYRWYLRWLVPLSVRVADKIITVSQSSKNDVVRLLKVPADKVEVIYNGTDESFRVVEDPAVLDACRRKHKLPEEFIMYLGTLEPRKNIVGLIKAFHEFRRSQDHANPKLVIAGAKGWMYSDIFNLVSSCGLQDDVIFLGYVDDEDIPLLYNCARIFVYPSFYEGFGLPVLEAMACGVPVITSNTSSLPEIVGDAGIMVDPNDNAGLAAAMGRLWRDEVLRRKMITRGLARASTFSWDKTAQRTLALYRNVLGGE